MNLKLLIQMFSGDNGGSSKRGALLCSLIVFFFIIIVNLYTGKCPDADLVNLLRDVIFAALAAVFGEPAIKAWGQKMVNNQNQQQSNTDKQT